MKYMGSKARFAKELKPIIQSYIKEDSVYIEPFVGGGNMICEVECKEKYGYDINRRVVSALNFIKYSLDSVPKNNLEFTEEMYRSIRNECESGIKSYVGFALSYGGKWFGGWCRDKENKRDYVSESYRNAAKQNPKIQNCIFSFGSYDNINIPKNAVVYCDPPYKGTTKYSDDFDHDKFYSWVRKNSENNIVLISEYEMPDDFICIWEKGTTSSLTKNTGAKKSVERLFIHKNSLEGVVD